MKKYPERRANFVKFEQEQRRELLTQSGSIDIFWIDGGYQDRAADVLPLLQIMRELQPQLIFNSRGTMLMADIAEAFESSIPRTGPGGYWETCISGAGLRRFLRWPKPIIFSRAWSESNDINALKQRQNHDTKMHRMDNLTARAKLA